MRAADVPEVVRIHLDAFPSFFLAGMGARVLAGLHRGILRDRDGIAFVATRGDDILGFVSGTMRPNGFYKRLFLHGVRDLVPAVFLRCLREPSLFLRILRRFRDSGAPSAAERSAALLLIAVSPNRQQGGTGTALVDAFLDEARRRGAKAVALTTDAADNEPTLRFYDRRGFRRASSYTTSEGRAMLQYEIEL